MHDSNFLSKHSANWRFMNHKNFMNDLNFPKLYFKLKLIIFFLTIKDFKQKENTHSDKIYQIQGSKNIFFKMNFSTAVDPPSIKK